MPVSLASVSLVLAADVARRGARHDGRHVQAVHVDRPEAGGRVLRRHRAEADLLQRGHEVDEPAGHAAHDVAGIAVLWEEERKLQYEVLLQPHLTEK